MDDIQKQDIEQFARNFQLSNNLHNKRILITGSTGLVGSMLVKCILSLNQDTSIVCPVREREKAKHIFNHLSDMIDIIECNLIEWIETTNEPFDYIIHCASPTKGTIMKDYPVETFDFIYNSTKELLKYAKKHPIVSMVFISSIECYGQILEDTEIKEEKQGYIDLDNPRNSYPMGKRAAEFICKAYAKEYNLPIKCARLTQTFGSGVSITDNRVFAQFVRSVLSNQDIILHTKGDSAKPYCYITDTVSAILYILLKGENGSSYNVANPDTFISIKDMAFLLKDEFNPKINVQFEIIENNCYAPETKLNLNADSLCELGWKPRIGMKDMLHRFIRYYSSFTSEQNEA